MSTAPNFFDIRDFDADEIVEGLYVGSVEAALNFGELKKRNITHIVTVAADLEPKFVDRITYMHVNINDYPNANIISTFPATIGFIDQILSRWLIVN